MEKGDLKKYSYLISGDVNLPIGKGHMQGTGFFIKRSNKLFFVCAKHTLSGCNDKNIKDDRTPDNMNIHVGDYLIPIDAKPIKDSVPCLPLVLDPDIISIPIGATKIKKSVINSINTYEGQMPENPSELIIWGFPNNHSGIIAFNSYGIKVLTDLFVIINGKSYTDQIHYCIEVNDKAVGDMAGFSGAPAFLKDANSNKFGFIGILVGTHKTANGLYVVQPKYLNDLVN